LALDDGKSAGKLSMAGTGHAVGFKTSGEGCCLTGVRIYGSYYGALQSPADSFHVYVCDADGKQIKDFSFPYRNFPRRVALWVTLKLPEPTEVPQKFIVCVGFNPTATKGVYVHHDAKPDGDSRVGLPGSINDAFDRGDWMIRAVITGPADGK
jgi:RNA polymerase sigma-70 factor (ECF subfamily)